MPTWNSNQYLKFAAERTRPAVELAARVEIASPRRVIDLGCGPGNSTEVLSRRWPTADLTGLDSSAAMLDAARTSFPQWRWVQGDIATWAAPAHDRFDVIFANASLQWVPDHRTALRRLVGQVADAGALAIQMPANIDAPPHRLMRELAASAAWRERFSRMPREWHAQPPEFYYDVLAPHTSRVDVWRTDYFHVLDSVDDIVEWYRGTGLRPWLDALADDDTRAQFLREYRSALLPEFPPRPDGRMIFPFRRLFVVAYR
jgi:trans-aconitate 2-methyltransferase